MKKLTIKQSVEVFHLCFLDQFSLNIDNRLYAIKGGCNLRFFCNSVRYSEDCDIDIQTIARTTLENKVTNILNSSVLLNALKRYNVTISKFSKPKQTQTTQRWKILLLISGTELPINTKIEFSRRGIEEDGVFEAVNSEILRLYQLGPIILNHYSDQSAYLQKLNALISRSETQARDVFDLFVLLSRQINHKNLPKQYYEKLTIAEENLASISFADFNSQVVSYLEDVYQQRYGHEKVWQQIQMQVFEAIEEAKQVLG